MKNFYDVPYSGKIEQIDAKQVNARALANETESYYIQQDRIAASGHDVNVVAQTANGIIVYGDAKAAQGAYDAAFGGISVAPKARANTVIQFAKPESKLADMLKSSFGYAAERFHMGEIFANAAAMPKADNTNAFVPKLQAA